LRNIKIDCILSIENYLKEIGWKGRNEREREGEGERGNSSWNLVFFLLRWVRLKHFHAWMREDQQERRALRPRGK
jgi:hypothetical protein